MCFSANAVLEPRHVWQSPMPPVKAFDTVQPIYGLAAVALLLGFIVERRGAVVCPFSA
jgi:hypothetical protein